MKTSQLCQGLQILAVSTAISTFLTCNALWAKSESDAVLLAREFIGVCAQNAGRTDKIAAAARMFGYGELVDDMKAMFAPQDPSAEFSGWLATVENGPKYLLGISNGEINGKDYSICVISNPNISIDEVLDEIRKLTVFGELVDNSEEVGQRYRVWKTDKIASQSFLSVVDAPKMGIVGGTISLSAPTEK
ncbi:MAG: hypothetical protein ACK4GO_04940 [Gemmobacter sp.]